MKKVLKASAGTGKTYSLSLEYLAALLAGQSYQEIVVMTFTRKATAEIRERIFEHLKEVNKQGVNSQVFKSLKKIYPDIVLDLPLLKNNEIEMLKNKDKIHIYTIDSFINQIFKKSIAPYLGIFNYQIVEEDKNKEIIEEIFKEILDNPVDFALMEKFLSENLERDLKNYLELIEEILSNRWKFLLLDYKKRSQRDCSQLSSKLDQCIDLLEGIAMEKGKEFSISFLIKDFQTLIMEYRELEGSDRKKAVIYKNYSLFFKNSFWNGSKIRGKDYLSLKEELEVKYQQFLEHLANYIYNQEIIPYEEEIFKFSQRVFEIADRLKFKLKAFTHSDISNYTYLYINKTELKLMDGDSFNQYFYELIGTDFKSIFIDEFQDTSILQWKILKPLLDNADKLISVGDQKQSIYGWRGGEKELFSKLEKIIDAETEPLLTCYRSQKEILDFVNDFFANLEIDWEYSHVSHLPDKNKGYLEVLLGGENTITNTDTKSFAKLNPEKQQEILGINSKIAANIKKELAYRIKEIASDNDIGVLARSNKHLIDIAMELDELGISYLLESKNSLLDHEAIRPLYFLLTYLNYNDYFSLLKFLRSDIIGVNHQTLRYLLENKSQVKAYLSGKEEQLALSDLEFILAEIKKLRDLKYQQLSNYIIEKSGMIDKYKENNAALKNIYFFFKIMRRFSCLSELMKFLEENRDSDQLKQLSAREENAVKLMTIHKSKGLSFDSDFFYWDPSPSRGDYSNNMEFYLAFDWQYQEVEDYLLTNSKYEKLFEYLDIDFAEEKKAKELLEEINNIYVAMTRAENNLFLYIEGPKKLEEDSDGRCWSGSSYDFYEAGLLAASQSDSLCELIERKEFGRLLKTTGNEDSLEVKIAELKPYFKAENISPSKLEEINSKKDLEMTISKELRRIEGLALHYYLENIKYNQKSEREYAYKLLVAKYGNVLGPKRINNLRTRSENFLRENQEYFSENWQVYNEYQLDYNDKTYRIDRLLLNQEKREIIILDYKSGYLKDQSQLDAYKNIIAEKSNGDYQIKTKFLEI